MTTTGLTTGTTTTGSVVSREFTDDFRDGFRTGGEQARWRLRPAGDHALGDATVRASRGGVLVQARGAHPATGEPAFTWTAPPGENDNLKWAAFAARTAATGVGGLDVEPGGALTATARVGGRTFGTAPDDPRAGSAAVVLADLESGLVCDLLLTSTRVYALYERLALPGGDHGAFTDVVPVAVRRPDDVHRYAITYDDRSSAVTWNLDGDDVFRVLTPGLRTSTARYRLFDDGGPEAVVRPRQLTVGLALLTLFDLNPHDRPRADRLRGQGAQLWVGHVAVRATPARPDPA